LNPEFWLQVTGLIVAGFGSGYSARYLYDKNKKNGVCPLHNHIESQVKNLNEFHEVAIKEISTLNADLKWFRENLTDFRRELSNLKERT
jgi:hypothetical protein